MQQMNEAYGIVAQGKRSSVAKNSVSDINPVFVMNVR
jgi:hypothetical protein